MFEKCGWCQNCQLNQLNGKIDKQLVDQVDGAALVVQYKENMPKVKLKELREIKEITQEIGCEIAI